MILEPPQALTERKPANLSMQILVVIDIELGTTTELQLMRRVQVVDACRGPMWRVSLPLGHGARTSGNKQGCRRVLAAVTL